MIFLVIQTKRKHTLLPALILRLPYSLTLLTILLLPFFLSLPDDNCRVSDYRRLKTKILDLHDKRYTGSNIHGAHKDNMAARKQLVDLMFKRFDADNNGQIDASELSQVRLLNKR